MKQQHLSFVAFLILIHVLLAMGRIQAQAPPKKYALLIGINSYRSVISGVQQLRYATLDVDTLEYILKQQGFEVTALVNNKAEREDILWELYRLAHLLEENDTFLLFFAGHGVRNRIVNDKTYWLTYDANLEVLDVAGIRLEHLLDYVRDIKAKYKLILLDHCFSGDVVQSAGLPIGDSRGGTGSVELTRNVRLKMEDFEKQMEDQSQGMVVIAAAKQEALESDSLKHGLFTAALCAALNTRKADLDKDANLSIEELKVYLKNSVPLLAKQIHNYQQEIMELTSGVNLSGWIVANHLPLDDLGEVQRLVLNYKSILDYWENMTWISFETKLVCKNALDKWVESVASGLILNETLQKLVEEIRKHMETKHLPEDARAKDLEDVVKAMNE